MHSGCPGAGSDPVPSFMQTSHNVLQTSATKIKNKKQKGRVCCELPKYSPNYLRVVIVAETFSEGVMVYFQLSDLCGEHRENVGKGKREGVSNYDRETREQLDRRSNN